jgi:hypothetical protein
MMDFQARIFLNIRLVIVAARRFGIAVVNIDVRNNDVANKSQLLLADKVLQD